MYSIFHAILSDRVSEVQAALADESFQINSAVEPNYACTALHIALAYRKYAIVSLLLDEPDINLDATDYAGNTPLMSAIESHSSNDYILALLDRGANIDATNDYGETAIDIAVKVRNDSAYVLLRDYAPRGSSTKSATG